MIKLKYTHLIIDYYFIIMIYFVIFFSDIILYIKEMYKITRLAIRNLFIIKKSFYNFTNRMQAENPIKFIDWKTDTYGDYPFIKSTFRSDRVWTSIKDIN